MIKKGLTALSLVACFCLATLFSINSSHAQFTTVGNEGGGGGTTVDCYSASSGTQEGAWFYDCARLSTGNQRCPKVDGIHSGASKECSW